MFGVYTIALMQCHLVTVFYLMGYVHMYVTCTFSLSLLVLETIPCIEALSHREVTLALPPSLSMYACQSAVPDQLTAVPTAATRGSQPPTQVGYTDLP